MNPPPLPINNQRKTDTDHLRLLAIFHFVLAGFAVLGIGFLFLHYTIMNTVINNPEMWKNPQGGGQTPVEFFAMFKWFYVCMGILLVVGGIGNLLSGLFILKKKNRLFSMVLAGINCIQFPFGTILGIFTLIVLLRPSVREIYEA